MLLKWLKNLSMPKNLKKFSCNRRFLNIKPETWIRKINIITAICLNSWHPMFNIKKMLHCLSRHTIFLVNENGSVLKKELLS